MRRRRRTSLTPVDLRDIYHEQGSFSAKFLLDPSLSRDVAEVTVRICNSDGKPMDHEFRRWGTKLTVAFKIDETTPDGVSVIDFTLITRAGDRTAERYDFWVIK